MTDYEDLILNSVDPDSTEDDCTNCPHKGIGNCHNQCLEVVEIWNPFLLKAMKKGDEDDVLRT